MSQLRPRTLLIVATVAVLVTALTGCSAGAESHPLIQPATSSSTPTGSTHVDPMASLKPVAGLTEMSAEQKHAELDSAFNAEWPVVAGRVTSVKLANPQELDFALAVAAPASSVEQWYRSVMGNRAFTTRADTTGDDGTVTITFFRAGLYYRVRIAPTAGGTAVVTSAVSQGRPPATK